MSGVSSLQNGPNDGVCIKLYDSTETIIDSVSYYGSGGHIAGSPDTGDAGKDDSGFDFFSLSRKPDGIDTNKNGSDFVLQKSTPGESNSEPTPPETANGLIIY
jgi:hypothetical protein